MVTNNEVSDEESHKLRERGIHEGSEEWNRLGIARFVNWPRTKCTILGTDIAGLPLEGDYVFSKVKTIEKDRVFIKVDFLPDNLSIKQKKSFCSLVNKSKSIKLPSFSNEDVAFLVSDDEKTNAAVLFDCSDKDGFLDAITGFDHIITFYIVTSNNALYTSIKSDIISILGKYEVQEMGTLPMSSGFKANAVFFKLGFLNKDSVRLGRQFCELLPVLWMKAGAIGPCPKLETDNLPDWLIYSENKMAILIDDNHYLAFKEELGRTASIETLFIITDFEREYAIMADELGIQNTFQLYRDYLDNFRINHSR